MSGRPTTRRSTRWSRLPLVIAAVLTVALPWFAARVASTTMADPDRAVSETVSDAFDDAAAVGSVVRVAVLVMALGAGTSVATALAARRRSTAMWTPAMHSSQIVPGGVGLRAPPLRPCS